MAVNWLDDPNYMESHPLVWLKQYLKDSPSDTKEKEVVGLSVTSNGILVVTHHWKAFIFSREKRCKQLLEAIPLWLKHTEPLPRLIAKPIKGEQFRIGLDDEFVDTYWEEREPGKYFNVDVDGYTRLTGKAGNGELSDLNPFLPGTTPTASTIEKPRRGQKKSPGGNE